MPQRGRAPPHLHECPVSGTKHHVTQHMQGGVFGAVAPSSMFLAAITPPVVQFLAGEPGAVGHPVGDLACGA